MFGDDAFPLWASKAGFGGEFFEHFNTCSLFLHFLDRKTYIGALLILFWLCLGFD
jgi:hypothetical protein